MYNKKTELTSNFGFRARSGRGGQMRRYSGEPTQTNSAHGNSRPSSSSDSRNTRPSADRSQNSGSANTFNRGYNSSRPNYRSQNSEGSTAGYNRGAASTGNSFNREPQQLSENGYNRARTTTSRISFNREAPQTNSGSYSARPSYGNGGNNRMGGDRSRRPTDANRSDRFGMGNSFSSGGRFSNNRGGGGGRFSRAPRGRKGGSIDISKFVNRSTAETQEVAYVSKHKFMDFPLDAQLQKNIIEKGFITPTPIQDQAIPHVLQGKDLIGIADTGTGKTASFLIPILNKMLKDRSQKALIIVPTRELALQIQAELRDFSKYLNLFSVLCIGGTSMWRQMSDTRLKHNFIIGTPGRLKDLVMRKAIDLSKFQNIVLDEVDRMLDMGFINDVSFLLEQTPKERQSLFYSATMTREVSGLIGRFTSDPVSVSLKTRDTASTIDQDIIKVKDRTEKMEALHDILIKEDVVKTIIFANTKHGVRKLAMSLFERGFKVESIHGDKTQARRQQALQMFKMSKIDVLIATDVAARGLDIADVTHVINYDIPDSYQDYIHRIGRTGRANKKGTALTFIEQSY